jgi:hypothetical protein
MKNNYNVTYGEARENLFQYGLDELQEEAERLDIVSTGLNKREIIELILLTTDEMGLIKENITIKKELQILCDQWEKDMKGDMLEFIEDEIEIYGTVKGYISYIVNECFPLWIKEADNDNKDIYMDYQIKFTNILKYL